MTPPLCARCKKPVATFDQWQIEECPNEQPALRDWGHQVTRDELLMLVVGLDKFKDGVREI